MVLARIGVFDAGIGGVPVAALLQARGYDIVYLGDSARRPYGPQQPAAIEGYVAEAERFFAGADCDAWVIACNSASVVAERALRGLLPCVDMVSAVRSAFGSDQGGDVGLIATAATVTSGAYPRALPGYRVHQVATEALLRLAEEGSTDHGLVRGLAAEAFAETGRSGCGTVILACTDFTCVIDDLKAAAGDLVLFDPLDAVLDLVASAVPLADGREAAPARLCLTGLHPVDVLRYAQDRFGLVTGPVEYVTITGADLGEPAARPR